jgi:hypothetical protein
MVSNYLCQISRGHAQLTVAERAAKVMRLLISVSARLSPSANVGCSLFRQQIVQAMSLDQLHRKVKRGKWAPQLLRDDADEGGFELVQLLELFVGVFHVAVEIGHLLVGGAQVGKQPGVLKRHSGLIGRAARWQRRFQVWLA